MVQHADNKNMTIVEAMHILELDDTSATLTSDEVRHKFRKLALRCHPDKNGNSPESVKAFHRLTEAHDLLDALVRVEAEEGDSIGEGGGGGGSGDSTGYFSMMHSFIRCVVSGMDVDSATRKNMLYTKVCEIARDCQCLSVSMFENIDRETSIAIYQILCAHRDLLHLEPATIDRIRVIIQTKFDDFRVFTVEPTLSDLLCDNVYKLDVDGFIYL